MKPEILRMERVTCRNREQTELQDVSLSIQEGDITGLVPVNTYGLDCLLSVLLFNDPIYYGYVYYCETCINSWKNEKRGRNPITLIDGSPALVKGMTVAMNLYAFSPGGENEVLHEKNMRRMLEPYLEDLNPERFGLPIPLDAYVEDLTPLQSIVVQILRAVVLGHRLIILREICSVLSEEEMEVLSGILRHYTQKGYAFLYISMHMEEIGEICTRAAVFSNGSVDMVRDVRREEEDLSLEESSYMVYANALYRSVSGALERPQKRPENRVVTQIRTDSIPEGIRVYEGECLAVQFLDTGPYQELVRALADPDGMDLALPAPAGGSLGGRQIAVLRENVAQTMVFREMSVFDNLCIATDHRMSGIWRNRRLRDLARNEYIRLTGNDPFERSISSLSREELTELVYMRIYMQRPGVLFIEQPFKGADVPMKQKVWEMIGKLLEAGITVVILTVNMADALAIADRAVRVGTSGQIEEYLRESFSELPKNMPWTSLYRDRKAE